MVVTTERRKNWRLRHLINCSYGLSLAMAMPCAALAAKNNHSDTSWATQSSPSNAVDEGIQVADGFRLLFLQLEPRDIFQSPSREELNALLKPEFPYREALLRALNRIDPDQLNFKDKHPIRAIKNGLGLDFSLPRSGNLHLNLYCRDKKPNQGLRINLRPVDKNAPPVKKLWSLGASLDSAKTVDGEQLISIVPQLLVDLDGLLKRDLPAQLMLKYGHWDPMRQDVTTDVRVAQLSLRLRF